MLLPVLEIIFKFTNRG